MFKAWAASQAAQGSPQQPQGAPGIDASPADPSASTKRLLPAQIRIQNDLANASSLEMVRIHLGDDIQSIQLEVRPSDGPYRNGRFNFSVKFSDEYPHKPPRVRCLEAIYHPNIERTGGVCLDILREAWSPVRSLTDVIIGIRHILLKPNATDPLNAEAAEDMIGDYNRFCNHVRSTMKGGEFNGVEYSNVL